MLSQPSWRQDTETLKARTSIARLAVVLLFVGSLATIHEIAYGGRSSKEGVYDQLLTSDLVVAGVVVGLENHGVPAMDIVPELGARHADLYVHALRVFMTVSYKLSGEYDGEQIEFIVNAGSSHVRTNYSPGDSLLVGLTWRQDVLGGSYLLDNDRARFIRSGGRYVKQRGVAGELASLDSLRMALVSVQPNQLLKQADLVFIGTVKKDELIEHSSGDGVAFVELLIYFDIVEVIKGNVPSSTPVVRSIRSGEYWPKWRPTTPVTVLQRGHTYCVFANSEDGILSFELGALGVMRFVEGSLYRLGSQVQLTTIDSVRGSREVER